MKISAGTTLFIVALVLGTVGASAASVSKRAEAARPMTINELFKLYHNRSWLWSRGAGFMANSKRRFTSIISVRERSYGEGNWYLPGRGKMCFRATWHSKDGSARTVTCFSHRKARGRIYQRREPDGDWYVFKNNPTRMRDEIRKVRHGDYVASRLKRVLRKIRADKR